MLRAPATITLYYDIVVTNHKTAGPKKSSFGLAVCNGK